MTISPEINNELHFGIICEDFNIVIIKMLEQSIKNSPGTNEKKWKISAKRRITFKTKWKLEI